MKNNQIRKDTAKHYKNIHRLLVNHPEPVSPKVDFDDLWSRVMLVLLVIAGMIVIFTLVTSCAYSDTIKVKGYSDTEICEAIKKAENSKSHPYGIMVTYKHTTPRQACLNTIKSARNRWNGEGDFIVFLGSTYSPPNDNPHWVANVYWFLKHPKRSKT